MSTPGLGGMPSTPARRLGSPRWRSPFSPSASLRRPMPSCGRGLQMLFSSWRTKSPSQETRMPWQRNSQNIRWERDRERNWKKQKRNSNCRSFQCEKYIYLLFNFHRLFRSSWVQDCQVRMQWLGQENCWWSIKREKIKLCWRRSCRTWRESGRRCARCQWQGRTHWKMLTERLDILGRKMVYLGLPPPPSTLTHSLFIHLFFSHLHTLDLSWVPCDHGWLKCRQVSMNLNQCTVTWTQWGTWQRPTMLVLP